MTILRLVSCSVLQKNDTVVKYALGDKAKQIFANTYQFHLPTEAELEAELKREIKAIKQEFKDKDEDE